MSASTTGKPDLNTQPPVHSNESEKTKVSKSQRALHSTIRNRAGRNGHERIPARTLGKTNSRKVNTHLMLVRGGSKSASLPTTSCHEPAVRRPVHLWHHLRGSTMAKDREAGPFDTMVSTRMARLTNVNKIVKKDSYYRNYLQKNKNSKLHIPSCAVARKSLGGHQNHGVVKRERC